MSTCAGALSVDWVKSLLDKKPDTASAICRTVGVPLTSPVAGTRVTMSQWQSTMITDLRPILGIMSSKRLDAKPRP
eukprot:CAMPEP_0197709448 /NCGR_PEP_ID=MMETSP1338-20131121/128461_1 /TAXON_ID=43686 ORGANISM="Pelagodinium beii, Strain RCC1491" /NCGR_SAMPLE_ID=MMETSP1338 /ASSEMBLY_ACC=CAM_ASM_000754 /LENGTH=75 /DNA_ID=CAMNT_0043293383 /DNA_START=572 /DNA_END=799 /DNA_ORIENTATION=+